jgi:RNA polymerase sigma factor (sigma-70 family)
MSSAHSVSRWITALKRGDLEAAQRLWDRYRRQLLELANRRLAGMPKRVADEEDVAQNVFVSLCSGAKAGRFDDVASRDDLWWLLLALTKQKVVDLVRRETAAKRGGGRVHSEGELTGGGAGSEGFTFDHLVGEAPTPEFLVSFEEQTARLLGLLRDDRLRKIATSRIEGYTVEEIAAELSVSTRSVERKLQVIRGAWTKELLRVGQPSDTT